MKLKFAAISLAIGAAIGLVALRGNTDISNPTAMNAIVPELVGKEWINAKPISLASRRGKVTIVEFWTFGCSNCQANLPAYARWHKRFAGKDMQVIGVHSPESSYEKNPRNVAQKVKDFGIEYPVLLDADLKNWNNWHLQYWPTVYLVDKSGRVRFRWEGELNWNNSGGEARMTRLIEALLAESK